MPKIQTGDKVIVADEEIKDLIKQKFDYRQLYNDDYVEIYELLQTK